MNSKCHVLAVALAVASACSCCSPTSANFGIEPPAAVQGQGFHTLKTRELEALLRGSVITQPDAQFEYMRTPEEFRENGTYVRYADNFEARGKYQIKGDSVCVIEAKRAELCRTIGIDLRGHYWISKRNKQPGFVRISVSPIRQ